MERMTVVACWGDMDFNRHVRNIAYLDKSVDARLLFFSRHGFPIGGFAKLDIGPVVMRDELTYFKEVRLFEGNRSVNHV